MNTKIRVALKLNGLTPEVKVTRAQGIKDAMQSSGNFPASSMPISYSSIQTLIDNLQNAILAANSGTSTSISFMHEQERILLSAFNMLKTHIEFVSNNNTDPTTIATSSGLQVAVNGGPDAVSELTIEATGNGCITLRVPRGQDEKAFIFEKSTDGTTFSKAWSSSLTKTSVTNLQPGSTVYIRYYAIGKNGDGAMSQPKSIIIT